MDNRLNVKVKAFGFLDLLAFKNLVPERRKRIEAAEASPLTVDLPMNLLARSLHPKVQYMIVSEVIDEGGDIISYRLVPDTGKGTEKCAYFRAGQYLSVSLEIDGAFVTRPVSISSSPKDALSGFYIISIKKQADGFVSPFIQGNWKKGTGVEVSGPEGDFYYESLRDSDTVIGIAGGCGITPFRAMARAIAEGTEDFNLIVLFGNRREKDIIFRNEFDELMKRTDGKIQLINVISDENPGGNVETGFITRELISRYAHSDKPFSVFMCGPQAMYNFVEKELVQMQIQKKFIRRELFGEADNVSADEKYPAGYESKTFNLKVHINGETYQLEAAATESLLTSLERGGVKAPSRCRSGECGFCRSRLISGDVFIPENTDGRRAADKKFGYIHTCSSYPLSDIEIEVPLR